MTHGDEDVEEGDNVPEYPERVNLVCAGCGDVHDPVRRPHAFEGVEYPEGRQRGGPGGAPYYGRPIYRCEHCGATGGRRRDRVRNAEDVDEPLVVDDPTVAAMYHLMDARTEADEAIETGALTGTEADRVEELLDELTELIQEVDERLQGDGPLVCRDCMATFEDTEAGRERMDQHDCQPQERADR